MSEPLCPLEMNQLRNLVTLTELTDSKKIRFKQFNSLHARMHAHTHTHTHTRAHTRAHTHTHTQSNLTYPLLDLLLNGELRKYHCLSFTENLA